MLLAKSISSLILFEEYLARAINILYSVAQCPVNYITKQIQKHLLLSCTFTLLLVLSLTNLQFVLNSFLIFFSCFSCLSYLSFFFFLFFVLFY